MLNLYLWFCSSALIVRCSAVKPSELPCKSRYLLHAVQQYIIKLFIYVKDLER